MASAAQRERWPRAQRRHLVRSRLGQQPGVLGLAERVSSRGRGVVPRRDGGADRRRRAAPRTGTSHSGAWQRRVRPVMAFGWLIALAGCVSYGVAGRWTGVIARLPHYRARPQAAAPRGGDTGPRACTDTTRPARCHRAPLDAALLPGRGSRPVVAHAGPQRDVAGVPLRWPSPSHTAGDGSRLRRPPRARALVHAGRPLPVGGGKPGLRESAARAAVASRSPDSHVRADCRRRLGAEAPARARPCPVAGHGHAQVRPGRCCNCRVHRGSRSRLRCIGPPSCSGHW